MKENLDINEEIIEEEALSYKRVPDQKKKEIESIIERNAKKKVD